MASLFKDPTKLSAYRDRRFSGTQEEYEEALLTSTTVYVGNMSFYTTEEQVYELFSRAGEIKKMVMGLDKNSKTPCGFCFVIDLFCEVFIGILHCALMPFRGRGVEGVLKVRWMGRNGGGEYYSREDAEDTVKYISGTILDDRPIRVDFDWGFQEGRQWGRGRSGGQTLVYRPMYHKMHSSLTQYHNYLNTSDGISYAFLFKGGYGKIVQKELEAQRQLVDYGAGSLDSFVPVMQPNYGRQGGNYGQGGSYRGRDYPRKRHREDDRRGPDFQRRKSDFVYRRNPDNEPRPEKNPRFRESGDSDEEDDDRKWPS
ncbi:hypothetical protein SASPL_100125 [Salvia splendens]|uniref:RRM domain-containing protein n=1 Tax=Salvia splendens TaxID=180675 RepID=A0A8X8YLT7_SALSN|nr:hypothetical protein SASPL_100125 [Salvia splendens]